MSVEVKGLREATKLLAKLEGRELDRKIKAGLRAAGRPLKKAIAAEAPRRSGKLRRSVSARAGREDRPSLVVGPRIWYRHFLVQGTRRGIRPNDFVTRGARRAMPQALEAFASEITKDLR